MPLYAVDITKTETAEIYIDALDAETARAEAEELTYDVDFDDCHTDCYAYPWSLTTGKHIRTKIIWAGGEVGDWMNGDEYQAWLTERSCQPESTVLQTETLPLDW